MTNAAKCILFFMVWGSAQADVSLMLRTGSTRALLDQGVKYEYSNRVDDALRLYCEAARRGSADGAYRVGWIYLNGRGGHKSDALAAAWFNKAAKAGCPVSKRLSPMISNATVPAVCDISRAHNHYVGDVYKLWRQRDNHDIPAMVRRMAKQHNVPIDLALAIVKTESNFNPNAVSSAGAMGLMQLMPATAERFGVSDPFDPAQNLKGGLSYLTYLDEFFSGDLDKVIAAYFAGENAIRRANGIPKTYPKTKRYLATVQKRIRDFATHAN